MRRAIKEMWKLAAPLAGKTVAHVNATAYGGGVSELLRSIVPLYRAFGIQADWLVIPGTPEFFGVTKGFHNALQGARFELAEEMKGVYLAQNREVAEALDGHYDFVIVYDPQPAPLRYMCGADGACWIWRCHIDTSQPDEAVLAFLKPFLLQYDALVFTMKQFVPAELRSLRCQTICPGIDPVSVKSMFLPTELCQGAGPIDRRRVVAAAHHTGLAIRSVEGSARCYRGVQTRQGEGL